MKSRTDTVMGWIEDRSRDARFSAEVERMLNEMRVRQDLIALREARGLSQAEVAKMLGVSQPLVARIESGAVKNLELRTLARLAAALGGNAKIRIERRTRRTSTRRRQAA
jgi:predicted XRE-type DNA-binding protein